MKTLALTLVTLWIAACGDIPQSAPKMIDADGATYFACEGMVWVTSESGTFKISFTDASHLDVMLRGIKKVAVTDLPTTTQAPMPYPLPSVPGYYGNGEQWKEGNEIDWPDGTKARLQGGRLVPVTIPAKFCKQINFRKSPAHRQQGDLARSAVAARRRDC